MDKLIITSVNASLGDGKGEIDLNWDSLEKADSYMIEFRLCKNKNNWILVDITNESKYTVKGLKHQKTYLFRVAAVNSATQGPWSKTIKKTIF